MKMTFIGATHEVTGSCTYLEVAGKRILVDFGMEQGRDTYENIRIPCAPAQIDYVLLTHAHIDHSGLLPLLYAGGIAPTFRNSRRSGAIERQCERAVILMCRCIQQKRHWKR